MTPVRVPGPHGIDDSAFPQREVVGPAGARGAGEPTPYRAPGSPHGPPGFHPEETPLTSAPLDRTGPDYPGLETRLTTMEEADLDGFFAVELPMALLGDWVECYRLATPGQVDIGEFALGEAKVLFDFRRSRRIATIGTAAEGGEGGEEGGGDGGEEEGGDLASYLPAEVGGPAPFGPLEKEAGESPGSIYFVRLVYEPWNSSQRPDEIEQGLIRRTDPRGVRLVRFRNGVS